MIGQQDIRDVLASYNPRQISIGVLGGHSALDVCHGAKRHGFRTLAVCQAGREQTYDDYYRTREGMGCVDKTIVLNRFGDVVKDHVQRELRDDNTVFIHNRYFWVYCDFDAIETSFMVPIFGSRSLLRCEERDAEPNQYDLLRSAGIRIPRIFTDAKQIDRLVMVKMNEAVRGYERAFFLAHDAVSYRKQLSELTKKGLVTKETIAKSVIEEYVVGAQVNFNFFYSPIDNRLELMGTDMRRQTDLDGFLRLTAAEQLELLKHRQPKLIETGHVACTIKESLIEKVYKLGEAFVKATKNQMPPGIIGPFALQGAVVAEHGKEDIVIFDVSMRIPGSPGTSSTPYSGYLYDHSMSYGERIARELKRAISQKNLHILCT